MGTIEVCPSFHRVTGDTPIEGGLQAGQDVVDTAELILDVVDIFDVLSDFIFFDDLLQLFRLERVVNLLFGAVGVVDLDSTLIFVWFSYGIHGLLNLAYRKFVF